MTDHRESACVTCSDRLSADRAAYGATTCAPCYTTSAAIGKHTTCTCGRTLLAPASRVDGTCARCVDEHEETA